MGKLENVGDFRIFDAIARTGSLSGAARDLALSLTTVSKRLSHIESRLGIRLILRTTRQLVLTPEGEAFHERARAVLATVSDAEELGREATARGVIRITTTVAFAQRQLAPRLPRFLEEYPAVELQINTSDRIVDLIAEKVDLAFRQASLEDSRLIGRSLAEDALLLVASPDYVKRAGLPGHPDHLRGHRMLTVGDPPPRSWRLSRDGEEIDVPVRSSVGSRDGEVAHAVALAGGGIAMKSSWDVIGDIRSGALVRVLPDWWGPPRMLRCVFPMREHQPIRVRALVEFMERELRTSMRQNADLRLLPSQSPSPN